MTTTKATAAARIQGLWVAVLAGALCSVGGCGPASRDVEITIAASGGLRASLKSYFVADPVNREAGLHLRVVTRAGGHEDVLCEETVTELPFQAQIAILFACLAREKPKLYSENIHESPALRRAVDLAEQRLTASGATVAVEDDNWVATRAQQEFERALEETGVVDDLVNGWKRVVEQRSSCYESLSAMLLSSIEARQRRLRDSGYCESWERFLNICAVATPDLLAHIRYFRSKALDPVRKQVLDVMFENGLSVCMAGILESRDPTLAADISKLGTEVSGGPETKRMLGERAWTHWRESGIEQWLDETKAAGGKIPQSVRSSIDACKNGQIPGR